MDLALERNLHGTIGSVINLVCYTNEPRVKALVYISQSF
jgi:hypothetical protein